MKVPHTQTDTHTQTRACTAEVSSAVPVEAVKDVGGGEDSDKSEGSDKSEEEVCPICLNELDEGEDLLVCSGCHNQLHQHCMDICEWVGEVPLVMGNSLVCALCAGAVELRQKSEDVDCPVCRTSWDYTGPPPSVTSPPATNPDTVISHKIGSPIQQPMSEDKQALHHQIKAVISVFTVSFVSYILLQSIIQ